MTRLTAESVGDISTGCRKTRLVHAHSTVENVSGKPDDEAEDPDVNVEKSVSARMTEEGSWDVERATTTHREFGPVEVATAAGEARDVSIRVYRNAVSPISVDNPGCNVDVSVSASVNDHGSYDATVRREAFKELSVTAVSRWATETSTTKHVRHGADFSPSASRYGEASGSPDDLGGTTTTVTEYDPIPVDSGWITWDSETSAKNGTYKYHHGLRVFKNQGTVPTPPRGANSSVSVSINKFGLFDGSISYDDLYSWEEGGSGGDEGGSTPVTVTVNTFTAGGAIQGVAEVTGRLFYGSGNEGAYASECRNCITFPGTPNLGRVVWKGYALIGNKQNNGQNKGG